MSIFRKINSNLNFVASCRLCKKRTYHRILGNYGSPEETTIFCAKHDLGNGCFKKRFWLPFFGYFGTCKVGVWKIARKITIEELQELQ